MNMVSRNLVVVHVVLMIIISVLQGVQSSITVHDVNQDRAECTDQLIGMATCLPYVGGEGKAPTMDCCTGLKQVLSKSLKCLCILVKDRNDPSLGLKINTTLALNLPAKCHSTVNATQCVDLLKLPMSSPDAQMFIAFEKSIESKNSTSTATPATSSNISSNSSSAGAAPNTGAATTTRRRPWLAFLTVTVASGLRTYMELSL